MQDARSYHVDAKHVHNSIVHNSSACRIHIMHSNSMFCKCILHTDQHVGVQALPLCWRKILHRRAVHQNRCIHVGKQRTVIVLRTSHHVSSPRELRDSSDSCFLWMSINTCIVRACTPDSCTHICTLAHLFIHPYNEQRQRQLRA